MRHLLCAVRSSSIGCSRRTFRRNFQNFRSTNGLPSTPRRPPFAPAAALFCVAMWINGFNNDVDLPQINRGYQNRGTSFLFQTALAAPPAQPLALPTPHQWCPLMPTPAMANTSSLYIISNSWSSNKLRVCRNVRQWPNRQWYQCLCVTSQTSRWWLSRHTRDAKRQLVKC